DPALAMERLSVVAGAADGADAEPLGGDRVVFAVAMQRNQHLGLVAVLCPDERGEKMLAMPESEDPGQLPIDAFREDTEAPRLESKAVCPQDNPQPFGSEETDSMLKPA